MEPQASSGPSPEQLPMPPAPEQGGDFSAPNTAPEGPNIEAKPGSTEGTNQNAGVPLPPVMPSQQAPVAPPADPAAPIAQPVDNSGNPTIADDVDVIEKEWVDKAKQIVDQTKNDPHEQNKEVNMLKADYMKKRYGKDLKLAED